jgi:hypothetical protein
VAQLIKRQASLPLSKNSDAITQHWAAFLQSLPQADREGYEKGLGRTIETLHKDALQMVPIHNTHNTLLIDSLTRAVLEGMSKPRYLAHS